MPKHVYISHIMIYALPPFVGVGSPHAHLMADVHLMWPRGHLGQPDVG